VVGPRRENRQHQCRIRRLRVGAVGRGTEPPPYVVHMHRRSATDGFLNGPNGPSRRSHFHRVRAGGGVRHEAGLADQPGELGVGVQFVEQDEGQVEVVLDEGQSGQGEGFADGLRLARAGGKVTQSPCPPLAEHLGRHLDNGVEQPADPTRLVPDRAERQCEEALLQVPVPIEENVLGFQEGRVTLQGRVVRLADDRPRLLPALGEVLPHRPGVLAAANDPIAVVVNLDEARPPDDADGQVRGEADVDCRAQALRPRLDRAERRPRPVHRPDQAAHLAAPGEEGVRVLRGGRRVALAHFLRLHFLAASDNRATNKCEMLGSTGLTG
jgi:hypothetical protein